MACPNVNTLRAAYGFLYGNQSQVRLEICLGAFFFLSPFHRILRIVLLNGAVAAAPFCDAKRPESTTQKTSGDGHDRTKIRSFSPTLRVR